MELADVLFVIGPSFICFKQFYHLFVIKSIFFTLLYSKLFNNILSYFFRKIEERIVLYCPRALWASSCCINVEKESDIEFNSPVLFVKLYPEIFDRFSKDRCFSGRRLK